MLLRVDGKDVATIRLRELATHLLGQDGSNVMLTMLRQDFGEYTGKHLCMRARARARAWRPCSLATQKFR